MDRASGSPRNDYAHAGLIALIVGALHEQAPELLPADLQPMDGVRRAHAPLELKRDLLERAWAARGARFVFEMGRAIRRFPVHPVLQAFLRSRDGNVLMQKWSRYERYAHGRHRTRQLRAVPGDYEVEHFSRAGEPPGPAEDVFILGFLAALLEELALPELGVALLPGERLLIHRGVRLDVGDDAFAGETARWRLTFAPGSQRAACLTDQAGADDAAQQVRRLLAEDPARTWSVAEAARATGRSARSLQRRLAAEGTAFTQLVREVRVAEACRLLETTTHSLTEVGYASGFSDAAHFSRDFRESTGASPTQFREVVT